MENSKLFRLNTNDFAKGLVVAVLAAVLGALQQGLSKYGLDFALYDWGSVLNLSVSAGIAYLSKNLLSEDNKVLGRLG